MDFNRMLYRHQLSLMRLDRAVTGEERRSHAQFARDHAVQIQIVRNELGAADAVCGFPT
jgi:hypothetical protein